MLKSLIIKPLSFLTEFPSAHYCTLSIFWKKYRLDENSGNIWNRRSKKVKKKDNLWTQCPKAATHFSILIKHQILSSKLYFLFCLIINVNLILHINFINQPSPYHAEFYEIINTIFSMHFFQSNYHTEWHPSPSFGS